MADEGVMFHHAQQQGLAERIRAARVMRRMQRRASGMETSSYHRSERRKSIGFVLLLVVAAVLIVALSG